MKIASLDEHALRAWMVNRVANELGVSEADVDTEAQLMSLGVESMTLIGMAGELAELIGEDLFADVMWEHPSISALARHLGSRVQSRAATSDLGVASDAGSREEVPAMRSIRWSPIRVFQANGDRTPLFLIHSVSGQLGCYFELARHLGENQPTYGLQQPPEPPQTVERMAEGLLDGVRTVQRRGPYRLAGYCFAGVMAYEMARQLERNGEEVELVAMFDPPAPTRSPRRPRQDIWNWISAGATTAARSPAFLLRELAEEPRHLRARFMRCFSHYMHRARNRLCAQQSNLEHFVYENFDKSNEFVLHNVAALQGYSPESYSGRVRLFQSTEYRLFHGTIPWQWQKLAGSGTQVFEIPCNHSGMMGGKGVEILTQRLQAQFDILASVVR